MVVVLQPPESCDYDDIACDSSILFTWKHAILSLKSEIFAIFIPMLLDVLRFLKTVLMIRHNG